MVLKKNMYILRYLKITGFTVKVKKHKLSIYYIFFISYFLKFFNLYIFFKRRFNDDLYKKYYFTQNIIHNFNTRNSFLNLESIYFISLGFIQKKNLNKSKSFYFIKLMKFFLSKITYILNNSINLYYLNISKKIIISFNFYMGYFYKCNKTIFKDQPLKINNILIKNKKIFGYMKLKKYPRKKKYLTKRFT